METEQDTELSNIKDKLLCYLLEAVEGNFGHLTADERSIVGDQETLDQILEDIGGA